MYFYVFLTLFSSISLFRLSFLLVDSFVKYAEYPIYSIAEINVLKEKFEARLARKKVLFHQDNAPFHKSTVAMTKLRIEWLWIDSSSTYSPAPCDASFCSQT